jgi:hypothetical protein
MVRKMRLRLVESKMIILELLVSGAPKADNKPFLCDGKLWRTYRANIAQEVYVKSSMME